MVKNLPANAGYMGSSPRSGRSPGVGNGNPLQYSCLRNPMDKGAWRATVHSVAKESDMTCVCVCVCVCVSPSVTSDSLRPHGLLPARHFCLWSSSGKNTGVGGPSFLQGIFPIQGSNSGLMHCRQMLYSLSQQGSLETSIYLSNSLKFIQVSCVQT